MEKLKKIFTTKRIAMFLLAGFLCFTYVADTVYAEPQTPEQACVANGGTWTDVGTGGYQCVMKSDFEKENNQNVANEHAEATKNLDPEHSGSTSGSIKDPNEGDAAKKKETDKKDDPYSTQYVPIKENGKMKGWPKFKVFGNFFVYFLSIIKYLFAQLLKWILSIEDDALQINGDGWDKGLVMSYVPNFTHSAMRSLCNFFLYASWMMYGFGLVFALTETAIAYQNGQGNLAGTARNVIVSFFYNVMSTYLMTHLFLWAVQIGNQFALIGFFDNDMADASDVAAKVFSSSIGKLLTAIFTVQGGIAVIIIILALLTYEVCKYKVTVLKRGVVFIAFMAKSCLIPFNLVRGSTGGAQNFIEQFLAFMIGMILQQFIFGFGLGLMIQGHVFEGLAFVMACNSVYGYLGTVGGGAEMNPLSDAHQLLHVDQSLGALTGHPEGLASAAGNAISSSRSKAGGAAAQNEGS